MLGGPQLASSMTCVIQMSTSAKQCVRDLETYSYRAGITHSKSMNAKGLGSLGVSVLICIRPPQVCQSTSSY